VIVLWLYVILIAAVCEGALAGTLAKLRLLDSTFRIIGSFLLTLSTKMDAGCSVSPMRGQSCGLGVFHFLPLWDCLDTPDTKRSIVSSWARIIQSALCEVQNVDMFPTSSVYP
jgi:hypothetical protein